MNLNRAVRIAKEAMRRDMRRVCFNANLENIYHAGLPCTEAAARRLADLMETSEIIEEELRKRGVKENV